MKSEYQKKRVWLFLLQNTVGIGNVSLSRIALRYYDDSVTVILTTNGFVSSNARYVTCSHWTDCHAESPSGRVQRFKMAKIDPVSPFYPTLWLEKEILQWENLQEVQKNEPLGCKYLLLYVSKHNYRRPTMKIPELRWCLTEITFNNPSQFPSMF